MQKYIWSNRLWYCLSLLLIISTLHASETSKAGTLSGRVKFADGTPADMATVIVKGTRLHTYTDEKGYFTISGISPSGKTMTVEVRAFNSQPVTMDVDFSKGHQKIIVTLKNNAQISLKEVVVSGKNESNLLREKGFAVNVIDTKEHALRNVQTNELLDRSAGVRIRQDGGLGSHIHYNINGMTGNAVKIFIDGVPASNFGNSFSLNSIPPSLIERIEVYKGVVPGHISEDALGGAINVILKKQNKTSVSASYSIGSFNTHQMNVTASHRTKTGLFADVSAFYNYSDNSYKVWGDQIMFVDYLGRVTRGHTAKRFNDAFRSVGTKIEAGWAGVKWADRFAVGTILSDDYKEIQQGVTMQRVFGDRHTRRRATVATLNYRKNGLFIPALSLKVDASYSHQRSQAIDSVGIMYDWQGAIKRPDGSFMTYTGGAEAGNRKTAEVNTNKSWAVRANVGYRIGENNSVFINHLFNNFDRGVSDSFLPKALQALQNTRDLRKNITTITFENLSFANRLRTNLFYKRYWQKVTSNEPYQVTAAPVPQYDTKVISKTETYDGLGGTLSFALTNRWHLMASAEKAIRFPNENEIFGNVANLVNPSNVHAEESFNANVGVNVANLSIGKHHIKGNVSLFYRDTKGMIRQAETPGNTGTTYYENLENVLTKGIDAEVSYTYAKKLNVTINVSKFDVLFNTEYNQKGERYLYYKQQIRNEPSFKLNTGLTYYIDHLIVRNSKASINYHIHYVNRFLRNWSNVGSTNLEVIPTQFANDMGLVFTLPNRKITIGVDAKNIFNRQIFDNFGLQKPGRAFYGKITYTIL